MKALIEWTGIAPSGTLNSLPILNLNTNREKILDYFNNTWNLTEVLFSALTKEEAFYKRPYHKLRHPLIFYYGHPATLYVNKLRVAGLLDGPVNAHFESLFETGVDEMRWDDLHEGEQNIWPTIPEVMSYRKTVYNLIVNLIRSHPELSPERMPITMNDPMWSLVMSFEHERIHLETSSVLMRELPLEFLQKPKHWPESLTSHESSLNSMITLPKGEVTLGKPSDWPSFGWDNEYGLETRKYEAFSASKFLITNDEFKEFVKDHGYSEEKYWSKDGWEWRKFRNLKWPTFWVADGPTGLHQYKLRTIFEVIPMEGTWPAIVNYYEAKAYCAWKTEKERSNIPYRLLSEAEHNAIRGTHLVSNSNFSSGSESSVNAFPPNEKGFYDTFGNVWQWCEDTFHPLKGGKPHPYYIDFSSPCYDGKHQMILGGSFISTGDESSEWARFHFRPHFFQHAGFRIVKREKSITDSLDGNAIYETTEMINKYLLMHWGSESDILDVVPKSKRPLPDVVHLPKKCAELMVQYAPKFERALDLGCAVGRSAFELAKDFKEVIGIDYGHEFIECANKLKTNKEISYWRKDSGSEGVKITSKVDPTIDLSRLHFEQGDACHLADHLKGFDALLLANVLCRLSDPVECLNRMQGRDALVNPGGILVMTTPFSWLDNYTPKDKWLNGIPDVKKVLTDFELIYEEELPFMIREHARKFEYIMTLGSVWRRKKS